MPNANWSLPSVTSLVTAFPNEIKARDEDLAKQFDGFSGSEANLVAGTIRWSSALNRWQRWSGTAWGELASTYALTSLTTTGNATINGNLTVTGTVTGSVGAGSFTQAGTGAVTRTVESKLRDVVSVKDFGAVGNGATDDTAAIQAAIDYAQTASGLPAASDGAFAVDFPPGNYLSGTLTVTGPIVLRGHGRQSTYITLKTGTTTSLLVFLAVNITGTSLEDFNHATISGMTLLGNRSDAVTVGASHGISCPGPLFASTTQYASSVFAQNLEIINFTGSGIVTGANRNMLWLDHVISRYNNDCGVIISGVDNKISNCEFGVTGDAAAKLNAGGTTGWVNCYFYFCGGPCVYAASTAVGPNWFTNCVFDTPKSHCIVINGPADPSPYSFVNCRIEAPGREQAANTYSHIVATNLKALNVHNCYFAPYAPYSSKSKYLLEAANVGYVSWIGNSWDPADPPYQTGAISSGIASIIRSDVSNQNGFGTGTVLGSARVGVDGDVGLQASTRATARYISRTDAGGPNPLVRFGMSGFGSNGFQGKATLELKRSDTFDGALSEMIAVTPSGNVLIGAPTEANAANGIQIANGGAIFGNPANSGFVYVDAGALKYKGTAGTVTTIANA